MSSALLNPLDHHDAAHSEAALGRLGASAATPAPAALRLQVAERLAAHRSRRSSAYTRTARTEPARTETTRLESASATDTHLTATRSARIAAAVAQRYAQSPSYRAFLAAEAERAIQQAHATAEVAARNAQAVAVAQQSLLEDFDRDATLSAQTSTAIADAAAELKLDPSIKQPGIEQASPQLSDYPSDPRRALQQDAEARTHPPHTAPLPAAADPLLRVSSTDAGLTIRFYEEPPSAVMHTLEAARPASGSLAASQLQAQADAEALALDEEIAFRRSPVFEGPASPSVPLPANLIEFPRQLVASRKARPRYAEGPLRDAAGTAPADGQLRIFEVDPAQISTQSSSSGAAVDSSAPQWTSLWLDAPAAPTHPAAKIHLDADTDVAAEFNARTPHAPQPAPLGRRALAAAIDAAAVCSGLLAFIAAFALIANHANLQPAAPLSLHQLLQPPFPTHAVAALASQLGIPASLLAVTGLVAVAFLYLLYQALFFTLANATPGMRCARIALCTLDDENPTRAAMRHRIPAVLLSACPLGLGFLWVALDEDRLAWHDRISRMYQRSY